MTFLLILAGVLLALSAALLFGPHLVVYGLGGLREAFMRRDAQIMGGVLVSALALLFFAPAVASSLISQEPPVQEIDSTMGWRFA